MKLFFKTIFFIVAIIKHVLRKIILYSERHLFRSIGKNVNYDPFRVSMTRSTISIGNNVFIGSGGSIRSSHGFIELGSNIMMGPNVSIIGGNHHFDTIGVAMNQIRKKDLSDPKIIIYDEVWLGANSIILPGVEIGRGAIIAAGSVVTKHVLPYEIVAGVPAKLVKKRFSQEQISLHEKMLYKKKPYV